MSKKRGRPRKPGERYANTDKLKPTGEPLAPALLQRIRSSAATILGDPRLGTQVGVLMFQKELTPNQAAAAFKIGEIYGRYEHYKGKKRSTRSPSYDAGFSGDNGDDEQLEERMAATKRAEKAWLEVQGVFFPLPGIAVATIRRLIEDLCVEDRVVPSNMLDVMRVVLDEFAAFFGVTTSLKPLRRPRPKKLNSRMPATDDPAMPKRVDYDRESFIRVARAMRPDLTEKELGDAFELQRAFKARAIFNRSKERRADNVVTLPRTG